MPRYRNSLHVDEKAQDPRVTRRTFLALLGAGACAGAAQMLGIASGGFLYPNAMKTPPSLFSIGRPQDVLAIEGKVYVQKYKTFVEVNAGKVRAQTAVCTHLGCTVNAVETGYSCPCHGSTYDLLGFNTGGPAPSPLVFFTVFQGASGELQVDKARQLSEPNDAWFTPIV